METLKKTIYAIPWYDCNLNCNHCEIHLRKEEYQPLEFKEELLSFCDEPNVGTVVLFGGEPLLHKKEMWEILKLGVVNCISTNLLLMEDGLAKILADADISIATSWNPTRFTKEQYDLWAKNLYETIEAGVDVKVLITLTPDLFEMDMKEVISVMNRIEGVGVKKFLFEPFVGDKEYHKKADSWLCKFHNAYKGSMINEVEERLTDWNCNCNETYTITPSGKVHRGCPMFKAPRVPKECVRCDKASFCRPCPLLKTCSYPKKLAKKVGLT